MSFEQTASGEWHFPSPNATPHTNRFSFPSNQSPPSFPGFSPVNPQGSWVQGSFGSASHHGTNAAKNSIDNAQPAGRQMAQQVPPQHKHQTQSNYSTHGGPANSSFVTTSFVQQFGETNIHSSSQQQDSGLGSDQPESQMQTPPPTRHTDAKRKPQQPAIDFATPSTIVSRRMSTPHEWHNQNQPPLPGSSPFHLSPLQFFNTGPLTAPVQSQPNFWDPNAFYSSPTTSNQMQHSSTLWSSPPAYQPIVPSNMPPSTMHHQHSIPPRPQTTLPSQQTSSASLQAPPVLLQSHVDPSLISKSDPFSAGPIWSHDGIFAGLNAAQRQNDSTNLEIPKRDDRARKNVRVTSFNPAPIRPNAVLRRSVTDSRPTRSASNSNRLSLVSADLQELTHDLQNAQIVRKHSPLKRQRSNTQSSTGSAKRKSVILKIDENGYASTEVQIVDSNAKSRGLEHMFVAGNDESDSEGDLPESTSHSRTSSAVGVSENDGKPTSSAQDALREMMQDRKKAAPRSKALDTAMMPPPTRALPPELTVDTALRSSASPTTISDPGMLTIDHLTANTRCICNSSRQSLQQQPMIQCGSCLNWLHTSCVGLNPLALPTAYLCNFCTSSSSSARTRRH